MVNHNGPPFYPDSIAIRNDTIRAVKRRSWADPHHLSHSRAPNASSDAPGQQAAGSPRTTHNEAEHIRALLWREQQRGRSSVNLSWIFGALRSLLSLSLYKTRRGFQVSCLPASIALVCQRQFRTKRPRSPMLLCRRRSTPTANRQK